MCVDYVGYVTGIAMEPFTSTVMGVANGVLVSCHVDRFDDCNGCY